MEIYFPSWNIHHIEFRNPAAFLTRTSVPHVLSCKACMRVPDFLWHFSVRFLSIGTNKCGTVVEITILSMLSLKFSKGKSSVWVPQGIAVAAPSVCSWLNPLDVERHEEFERVGANPLWTRWIEWSVAVILSASQYKLFQFHQMLSNKWVEVAAEVWFQLDSGIKQKKSWRYWASLVFLIGSRTKAKCFKT